MPFEPKKLNIKCVCGSEDVTGEAMTEGYDPKKIFDKEPRIECKCNKCNHTWSVQ